MAIAEEELKTVRLRNDFYHDGFHKILIAFLMMTLAIALLCALSVFLYLQKPSPVAFVTDDEWRVLPPVPVNEPYLQDADLVQWVTDTIPKCFMFDFISYSAELSDLKQYYTQQGFKKLLTQINVYANEDTVHNAKMFVSASAGGAPIIINKGLLPEGNFGWWLKMPIILHYASAKDHHDKTLTLKILLVRVPTLNNLNGVAIDSIEENKDEGGAASNNG